MNQKFGFIPVHSQFIETEEALKNIVGKYFELFESIGGERKTKETLTLMNH